MIQDILRDMVHNSHRSIRRSVGVAAMMLSAMIIPSYAEAETNYWHQRVSLFDQLPIAESDIVFVGNSITDGGEFTELLGQENVLNRGIIGDVIGGVHKRINQVTKYQPAQIFLLIGINDVSHGLSVKKMADQYEALVKDIRTSCPNTQLFIESVLPINNDFKQYKNLKGREHILLPLNAEIKKIAEKYGCTYIDLWNDFADENTGKMMKKYTNDGLHLNGQGYRVWAEKIKPYLAPAVERARERRTLPAVKTHQK